MGNKIKPTELRIGNLVQFGINIVPIKSIYTESFLKKDITIYVELNQKLSHYCLKIEEISPIQLTKEWLEKFGFEEDNPNEHNGFMIFNSNGLYLNIFTGTEKGFLISLSDVQTFQFLKPMGGNIKYVHQLQNLYFALTGEELIIKQQENEKFY